MKTFGKVKIAPSLLSSDFSRLFETVKNCEKSGAELIHFDVMDGYFVPNITFGPKLIKDCRSASSLPFDVHLMIARPDIYLDEFISAGADIITVHIESSCKIEDVLKRIKSAGKKIGITLKPKTSLEELERYYEFADLVLVMSVEPGFGGQKWIQDSEKRIIEVKRMREEKGFKFEIEVDGGINEKTGKLAFSSGADILVAGSYLFKQESLSNAIRTLKSTCIK
ncbi:TPA: ribulose-phosphate 3-epimerase [bacterium]|nr:MAG: ribulose-phosphate 3-epimerase [Candidatus Hydrogenedentes bacterium CG1_02_42_14]HBW46636.1 ribulose-phosphate 3-epimerase [bacterium]